MRVQPLKDSPAWEKTAPENGLQDGIRHFHHDGPAPWHCAWESPPPFLEGCPEHPRLLAAPWLRRAQGHASLCGGVKVPRGGERKPGWPKQC